MRGGTTSSPQEKGASTTKTLTLNTHEGSNLANGKKRKHIWNDKQHSVSTTLKPSRQEEFENLLMNFFLDQEEKVKHLEEYMDVIGSDFMQLSLEVVGKLKEEIRMKKIELRRSRRLREKLNPQSTPQVLPSFEEYIPPVTYPEEVQETLGTPIEVEPLDETQLEDLSLNTCNHNTPFSSREVPSFNGPEPQPLLN
ncbi:hypothetical protein Tco_1559066, partial [Tanacetum coccineum]